MPRDTVTRSRAAVRVRVTPALSAARSEKDPVVSWNGSGARRMGPVLPLRALSDAVIHSPLPQSAPRWHFTAVLGADTAVKCHFAGCRYPGSWLKTCRRIQACIAIAAAEAALIERVDPNCSIDSVATAASWTSGVRPGPSWPNTSTQSRGSS